MIAERSVLLTAVHGFAGFVMAVDDVDPSAEWGARRRAARGKKGIVEAEV
jgi:hypothetical protein